LNLSLPLAEESQETESDRVKAVGELMVVPTGDLAVERAAPFGFLLILAAGSSAVFLG
jgi:hypothetical protein